MHAQNEVTPVSPSTALGSFNLLVRLSMRTMLRRWTTKGLRRALREVVHEASALRKHRAGLSAARRSEGTTDLRLNLGCGSEVKPGWVNVDLTAGGTLALDLREALPFSDGSCAIIYSEHFLEHLSYPDDAGEFLAECLRVLKPGGVFSVGVPDTALPLRAYCGGVRDLDRYMERARLFVPPSGVPHLA